MILWIDNSIRPHEGPYIWRRTLKQAQLTIETFEQFKYCTPGQFEDLVCKLESDGINEGNIYFHDETIALIDISRDMTREYTQLLDWMKASERKYHVLTHEDKSKYRNSGR